MNTRLPPQQQIDALIAALHDTAALIGVSSEVPTQLRSGAALLAGLSMDRAAANLLQRADNIRRGVFNVLVVGEFKNGKSTLLNAMLGKRLLLARVTPTTAVISLLVHGYRSDVLVSEHGQQRVIDWDTFRREFHLTSEDAGVEHAQRLWDVDYVQIECQHDLLRAGIRLIDSPGLGEHIARTRLTMQFLRQAHAVIVVLRAGQLLSQREIDFIEMSLGKGRMPHVFFVVNLIDRIADDEERVEVEALARQKLNRHFRTEAGEFDEELYRNRVFFTSALWALQARTADPPDSAKLDASGVPALERELRLFLEGGGRLDAVTETSLAVLASTVAEARRKIAYKKTLLRRPLEEIERQFAGAEKRLDRLSRRLELLRRDLQRCNEAIKDRIYVELIEYITAMRSRWEADSVELIRFDDDLLRQMVRAQLSRRDQEAVQRKIDEQIQRYLAVKFATWAETIPAIIEPEVEKMIAAVRQHTRAFQLELRCIAEAFAGGESGGYATEWSQRVLSQFDVAQLKEALLAEGIGSDSVGKSIKRGLATAVVYLLTGSLLIALPFAILLEIIGHLSSGVSLMVRRSFLEQLGEKLFDALTRELTAKRQDFYRIFDGELTKFSNNIVALFQAQLEETRREHEQLVRKRRDDQLYSNQEQHRLEIVEQQLIATLNHLRIHIYGAPFGDAELDALLAAVPEEPVETQDDTLADEEEDELLEAEELADTDQDQTARTVTERLQGLLATLLTPKEGADIQRWLKSLDTLVGLQSVKQRMKELAYVQIDRKKRAEAGKGADAQPLSLHMVFRGNPGTGKTTVAQLLGTLYANLGLLEKGHLVEAKANDLIGPYVGWTQKQVMKKINDALDGVLFIDEAYQLVDTVQYGQEAINLLTDQMEKHRNRLAVVVAGYPAKMEAFINANPGLRSRFPKNNYIDFPDYAPDELMAMLLDLIRQHNYTWTPEAERALGEIADNLYAARDETFGNAREMRNLAEEIAARYAARVSRASLGFNEPIRPEDIPPQYADFVRSGVQHPTEILDELDRELVGLAPVKQTVRELAAMLEHQRAYGDPSQPPMLHMIFAGNPGTGKTTIARTIGKLLKSLGYLRRGQLVEAKLADLVAEYLGQTAPKTQRKIKEALDGVLFIDEAYQLVETMQYGQEAINTLLVEMENKRDRLVVILAGYPEAMERFRRSNDGLSSRIAQRIDFPDYTREELGQIWQHQAAGERYTFSDATLIRVQRYLVEEGKHDPTRFGNGRAARNLFERMKRRLAVRVMALPSGSERDRIAHRFEADDVPELDLPVEMADRGNTVVVITQSRRLRLDLTLPDAGSDHAR